MPEQVQKNKIMSTPEKSRAQKNGVKKHFTGFAFGQGINLIPQDKEAKVILTQRSVVSHLLASVFISIALVALTYGILYAYSYTKQKELASLQQERLTLDQSIAVLESRRSELVQYQATLEKVKDLLSNHIKWTQFFTILEGYTLPDVTYTNVIMSPQGTVHLGGIAKDYTTLARQLQSFEEGTSVFRDVSIPAGQAIVNQTGDTIGVSFDASLTLKEAVLTTVKQ